MYSRLSIYSSFYKEHFIEVNKYNSMMNDLQPLKANDVYKNTSLVLFYSSTCKHCTEFMPIYNDIVNDYNHIIYYKANCTLYSAFINEFDITHAPSLILFYKGKQFIYKGEFKYEPVVQWLKKEIV